MVPYNNNADANGNGANGNDADGRDKDGKDADRNEEAINDTPQSEGIYRVIDWPLSPPPKFV